MKRTAIRSLLLCALSLFLTTSVVRWCGAEPDPAGLVRGSKGPRSMDDPAVAGDLGSARSSVGRSGKSSVSIETFVGNEKDSYPAVKFSVVPKPGEPYCAEAWIKSECQNELGGFIVFETTQGGEVLFEQIDVRPLLKE